MNLVVNRGRKSKVNYSDLLFCLALLIWPTLQFGVFYIGVNFNSFLMMFQKFDLTNTTRTIVTSMDAFKDNWKWCFDFLSSKDFMNMLGMSLFHWVVSISIGSPLGLLFSYYIAKKFPGAGFFRIVLYLPAIISALILVLLYTSFVDFPFSTWTHNPGGYTNHDSTAVKLFVLIFFNIWSAFGASVLMYANAMSAISPEIYEAAALDGAKGFKEFIHIVFPMIFPTYSVFFVTSIANIFMNQANLYSIYGNGCPVELRTLGYYMFNEIKSGGYTHYPKIALLGIVFSLVAIPLTLITRKLFDKYGPSAK